MAKKQEKKAAETDLVCVYPIQIEQQRFPRGTVIGSIDQDGRIVPKHKGVTRGDLEARLRNKLLQVGPLEVPAPAEAGRPAATPLPEGFPFKVELEAAGVATLEQLLATDPAAVEKLEGIGDGGAAQINDALKALKLTK